MSKEYVEREVISEGIRKYYYKNPPNSSYQEGFDRGLDKAQRVILNAPVADVAPVVRCKDCAYWTKIKDSAQGRCALFCHYPTGSWYCANGERKKMSKEYIDREEALSAIKQAFEKGEGPSLYIKRIPAADVVEVVRCRECKYWGDEAGKLQRSDGALFARCKVHNYLLDGRHTGWCPTGNDFCSYGERKEGAD